MQLRMGTYDAHASIPESKLRGTVPSSASTLISIFRMGDVS